jgi:hypothetical protein
MWGVVPSQARLAAIGVQTIGQIAQMPGRSLERLLGHAAGEKLSALAWIAIREDQDAASRALVCPVGARPQAGRGTGLPARARCRRQDRHPPAGQVARRPDRDGARALRRPARGHAVGDARRAIAATASLAEIAEELVRAALADHPDEKHISLLAISVAHLAKQSKLQLELSLGLKHEERRPGTRRGLARHAAVAPSTGSAIASVGRSATLGGVGRLPFRSRRVSRTRRTRPVINTADNRARSAVEQTGNLAPLSWPNSWLAAPHTTPGKPFSGTSGSPR